MAIRNSAKALIVSEGKILVNRCVSESGEEYYDLPGGGQHQFESAEEAVAREVLEETGYHVRILRFAAVAEEIQESPQIREKNCEYSHRMALIFLAEPNGEPKAIPMETDMQQKESVWLTLEEADRVSFYPRQLRGNISKLVKEENSRYLGCVRVE